MADGDILVIDKDQWSYKLLDAHNSTAAGPWVEVPANFCVRSFWCNTCGTDTINIEVSSAISLPSATTSGVISKAMTGTTNAGTVIEAYRWLRATKTGTAVTTTCVLVAVRQA